MRDRDDSFIRESVNVTKLLARSTSLMPIPCSPNPPLPLVPSIDYNTSLLIRQSMLSTSISLSHHSPSMEVGQGLQPTDLSAIAEKLGYPLRVWQKELTESILQGKDVVLTAGTGRGKTTLLYASLLAARLRNPTAIGLSFVQTRALGVDQVCFSRGSSTVCSPKSECLNPRNVQPVQRGSLLL